MAPNINALPTSTQVYQKNLCTHQDRMAAAAARKLPRPPRHRRRAPAERARKLPLPRDAHERVFREVVGLLFLCEFVVFWAT
jgi:hypothetical protein